jgi:hypothetical protein
VPTQSWAWRPRLRLLKPWTWITIRACACCYMRKVLKGCFLVHAAVHALHMSAVLTITNAHSKRGSCVLPGWFDQAAAEQAEQEVGDTVSRSAASCTQPSASASASGQSPSEAVASTCTPRPRHAPDASVQSQPIPGNLEAYDRDSDQRVASAPANGNHAAASDSTTSFGADHRTAEHPEHPAALAQPHTADSSRAAGGSSSSSSRSAKEQRAAQRRAEADRSWDSLLLRFAESSLFKGGPLPSLQVIALIGPCQLLIAKSLCT